MYVQQLHSQVESGQSLRAISLVPLIPFFLHPRKVLCSRTNPILFPIDLIDHRQELLFQGFQESGTLRIETCGPSESSRRLC